MDVELDVHSRQHVPSWLGYGTPVFTVLAALLVGSIALVALGIDPIAAYSVMFVNTLTSEFGLTKTLVKAVPLVLTGLAVYLPMRAGLWNIGAEGQLIFGALAGTWVGLNVSLPWYLLVPLMFVASGVAGAVWAGIPAVLRARWDVNEIITTLLLTFVAQNVQKYLLRGPMQGGLGNFPQTASFSSAATIPDIPGTGVHAGVLVAVLMVAIVAFVMARTRLGFEISFVGSNADAAEQAGMSRNHIYLFVLLAAGALAAFGGISDIAGVQGRFQVGYDPGYGFTAVVIALLGRNGAIRVAIAACFFAVLTVGGSSMEVSMGVPSALVNVIQALIILFLITAEFFKRYRVGVTVERGAGRVPMANTESEA